MFLSLLLIPATGFLLIVLLGRYVMARVLLLLNIVGLVLAIFCALFLLNDVIITNSPVIVNLGE